jgi:hypothetical protein
MSWVITGSQKVNWDPSLISTALWLDAADASTVTASSSLITEWRDKSGNGKHVTAADALRPTYTSAGLSGRSVVTYSGSQRLQAATASDWAFMHNGSQYAIFAAWQAGTSSDPNAPYALCSTRTSGNTLGVLFFYDDRSSISVNNQIRHLVGTSSGLNYILNSSSDGVHAANTPVIIGLQADVGNATASLRSTIRVNDGTAIQNNVTITAAVTGDPQHPLIVGSADGSIFLTGFIAEFVIINGATTTDTRQRINGYLAHKWGLTANLPETHPYKYQIPTPGA